MTWPGEAAEHDFDHGEPDPGGDGSGVAFEVAGKASVMADPGEGALDDPTFRQDDEAMGIGSLHDFESPASGRGDGLGELGALVAGIGEDALDERKGPPRLAQQGGRAVPILHVGRMDRDAQQEAERVDEDVPLAARDLLARIEALRVERGAPF